MLDFSRCARRRISPGSGRHSGTSRGACEYRPWKQWAAITAIAVIGGCSWFSDEPTPRR